MLELYAQWMRGILLLKAREVLEAKKAQDFYISIGLQARDAQYLMAFAK
jgi:hypothetical protein